MKFYTCQEEGCEEPLGSVDDGTFNVNIVKMGMCRYHFLKRLINSGYATEDDKKLFELLSDMRNKRGEA